MSLTTPVIEQIHRHASVRTYKADPIPEGWVEAIVAAGQRAATSSNLQTYAVVAVTSLAKRTELARLCGNQAHIIEAPVFLAWCADLSKLDRASQLRQLPHDHSTVESFLVSAVDVALAAQNAVLAAESLGLGICYIGAIRNQTRAVIELLGLPPLFFPITGLTLGWPAIAATPRPRLPQPAILHWESYSRAQEDAALLEYDQTMIATGIYANRQVAVPGRPSETENYGWLEHSARRVSQPLRVDLRQVLQDQGFALQ
ncbi:MAG: NADPH-dependent oxidoreductase [Caldilineaceae bacterium]|nr:NADPH-dependent oxidoreductase [Caldilineaceae bacterium]